MRQNMIIHAYRGFAPKVLIEPDFWFRPATSRPMGRWGRGSASYWSAHRASGMSPLGASDLRVGPPELVWRILSSTATAREAGLGGSTSTGSDGTCDRFGGRENTGWRSGAGTAGESWRLRTSRLQIQTEALPQGQGLLIVVEQAGQGQGQGVPWFPAIVAEGRRYVCHSAQPQYAGHQVPQCRQQLRC